MALTWEGEALSDEVAARTPSVSSHTWRGQGWAEAEEIASIGFLAGLSSREESPIPLRFFFSLL